VSFILVLLVVFSIPLIACFNVIEAHSITNQFFKAVLVVISVMVVAPINGAILYFALIILVDGFNLGLGNSSVVFLLMVVLVDAALVMGLYDALFKEITLSKFKS
jgi:hypothetical protein